MRKIGLLLFGVVLLAASATRPASANDVALMIAIEGPIGPAVAEHVTEGLHRAAGAGAPLVILGIDTPGGLEASMHDINAAILASPVPVACWVAPAGARAASAGTYIMYACHVSAMAPGTNIGAATPVTMGGEASKESKDKAVNDAVANIRSLADLRGRNADWAERAVREGAALPAAEAKAMGVVDLLAADADALLAALQGRKVSVAGQDRVLATKGLRVERFEPGFRSRALALLGRPEVAYLLLTIGIYGIMFELMAAPGTIFPGVAGSIALLLGLYALNLLPVNYAGAGLMLLGIALMVAEAFVPSFGALGIGGMVAFAVGSLMMFKAGIPGYELSLGLVVGTTLTSALVLGVGLGAAIRSRHGRPVTGGDALLGRTGTVFSTWERGGGQIQIGGEIWNAEASQSLKQGDLVRVVRRRGLTLTVEPVGEAEQRRP